MFICLRFGWNYCVYEIREVIGAKHNILYTYESLNTNSLKRITLLAFPLGSELGWKWEVWIIPLTLSKKDAKSLGLIFWYSVFTDVPFSATPVNAFYNGCMEVSINSVQLDLDEAISKHNDIRAHSCPSIWKNTNDY